MNAFNTDPRIDVVTSSGMLRVTVHPRLPWLVMLFEVAAVITFAVVTYRNWASMSLLFHVLFVWAVVSGAVALVFHQSGTEVIVFDAQKLTISKEVHGWERKREFSVDECRELQWMEGSEGSPRSMQCKTGWKTIKFGKQLSENQAIEILMALQQTLPEVAQQMCSYPAGKKHFITLGLS